MPTDNDVKDTGERRAIIQSEVEEAITAEIERKAEHERRAEEHFRSGDIRAYVREYVDGRIEAANLKEQQKCFTDPDLPICQLGRRIVKMEEWMHESIGSMRMLKALVALATVFSGAGALLTILKWALRG